MREMVDEAISILRNTTYLSKNLVSYWIQVGIINVRFLLVFQLLKFHLAYTTAKKAGAIGGKIRAGGGGFILFFDKPDNQPDIIKALDKLVHVLFKFENSGSRVVLYQPNGF